jgi:hypothetical protein
MKRIIAMLIASVAFAGLVVWGTTAKKNLPSLPVVHADAPRGCSLETVAGNWTVSDTRTVTGIGPRAAVGTFTFDTEGNLLNGAATLSLNGTIAGETFSGAYTVNSNCTGTINGEIFDASSGAELFAATCTPPSTTNRRRCAGFLHRLHCPTAPDRCRRPYPFPPGSNRSREFG